MPCLIAFTGGGRGRDGGGGGGGRGGSVSELGDFCSLNSPFHYTAGYRCHWSVTQVLSLRETVEQDPFFDGLSACDIAKSFDAYSGNKCSSVLETVGAKRHFVRDICIKFALLPSGWTVTHISLLHSVDLSTLQTNGRTGFDHNLWLNSGSTFYLHLGDTIFQSFNFNCVLVRVSFH